MPSFRKCLAVLLPSYFSSAHQNSSYSRTHSARASFNKLGSRSRSGTGASMGGIRKTVDTNFTVATVEDDEHELFDTKRNTVTGAPSQ
jgi:hypothetical protein